MHFACGQGWYVSEDFQQQNMEKYVHWAKKNFG